MSTAHDSVEAPTASLSVLPNSRFLGHIYSYPTVTAAVDYAANLPVVHTLATRATPIVNSLKERSKPISEPIIKRATPILTRADDLGDKLLTRVDESFPQLKETKSEDVIDLAKKPYETVVSTATAYSNVAQSQISASLVDPLKKAGERAKEHYIAVYDSTGKPLIKNNIDPLLTPVNHKLEDMIKSYLPEGTPIPTESSDANEIARTLQLAQIALQRAKPVIDEQASHLATLPHSTRQHVLEVFDQKLAEYGKDKPVTGPLYAYIATWKQLSAESVSLARYLLSTQIVFLKSTLGSKGGSSNDSNDSNGSSSNDGDDDRSDPKQGSFADSSSNDATTPN